MSRRYILWYTGEIIFFHEDLQSVFMKYVHHLGSDHSMLHEVGTSPCLKDLWINVSG